MGLTSLRQRVGWGMTRGEREELDELLDVLDAVLDQVESMKPAAAAATMSLVRIATLRIRRLLVPGRGGGEVLRFPPADGRAPPAQSLSPAA